jgi:two-component system nitrogen regulation response regulator GlnG
MPTLDCDALRVLLVDDEASFRLALAGALEDDGHPVVAFGAVEELPDLATLADVSVLVTDYDLPGQSGFDLVDRLRARFPHIPVIVVTAYRNETVDGAAAIRGHLPILDKPLDYEAMHALLHRLTSAR